MYIYCINIAIEGDENPAFEFELWEHIEKFLDPQKASLVSAMPEELIGDNYGRCVACGGWVSDATKPGKIRAFSNGARVNGDWYCDLCLPEDHPNRF